MQTQLPRGWRELLHEAERLGVRILAINDTAGDLADCDQAIAKLLAEAKSISEKAETEERELSETEDNRLFAIMGDDASGVEGEICALKQKRSAIESRIHAKKKLALEIDASGGRRDPLADLNDTTRAPESQGTGKPRPTLTFQDSHGRTIRSLGVNDRFGPAPEANVYGGHDGERSPGLAERINAHLTGRPLALPSGQTLFTGEDGSGGYLTGVDMFGSMIDLARPNAVSFQAGAQTIPVNEGSMELLQQLSDPTVGWYPELARVKGSTMTFGKIRLKPKKLAAIVPISLEMIEDASNAVQLIEAALTQAMAVALDQAILSGLGTDAEPLGIRNQAGVNVVDATTPPDDYLDLENAIEAIDSRNYPGQPSNMAWIANPRDHARFNRLQATDAQPLQATPGAAALRKFKTTSLPIDLGTGENESEMIVGDMSQVIVGMRTGATVRFLPAGTITTSSGDSLNAAEQMATLVVIHMRADVAVIRPEWLTIVKGVKWS